MPKKRGAALIDALGAASPTPAQKKREAARAKREAARAKKAEIRRKKDEATAARRAERERRQKERQDRAAAATLKRQGALAARSKQYPSTTWESRFWAAIEQLHPDLRWDNARREEIYASIVPLWRVHRWAPEEAAQAVCLRCEVPTDPPQAAPVLTRGQRVITERVRATPTVKGAALRPTHRPDLPDLPATRPRAPARGATCPADRPECGYAVQGGACTISARLTVAAKGGHAGTEQIAARYCVQEIGQLHTSHLPLRGFRADPDFPATAQERDYGQRSEQAKVLEIARTFDPALIFNTSPGAIDGVPVATEEGIVLGGNGRTMATRLVYAGQGGVSADVPRAYLVEHAHEFGLDAGVVARFQAPMLVRTVRVAHDPRTLAEWSRRLNVSLSQQLDAVHLAVSRARFLDDSTLRELAAAMGEDETLAAFLGSARSRPFVRALQSGGVIDGRAAAAYLGPDGLLTEAGRDLVADLLVAVLLPDAQLISAYGRGPVGALARAAPYLVTTSTAPAYDLREQLRAAVRDRLTMRAQGLDDIGAYLRQGGLFGAGPAVGEDRRGRYVLQVLTRLEASPAKLARFSRAYAELAAAHPVAQGGLFAADVVSPLEALQLAADQVGVPPPP